MSFISKPGIDVIISLGSKNDGRRVKARMQSKDAYRKIEIITLEVDDKGELVDPTGRDRKILAQLDQFSRITIIGHSSARGSTLQLDRPAGSTVPVAQLTRHFSEITGYIATRVNRSLFNHPTQPLAISLRSCYGAVGKEKSLAAKMQRNFAVAHDMYCTITARTNQLFIGDHSYTIDDLDYALSYSKQVAKEIIEKTPTAQRKNHYIATDAVKTARHKAPGTKMYFSWDVQGQQVMADAYAHNRKFIHQARAFYADLRHEVLCMDCKELTSPNVHKDIFAKLAQLAAALPDDSAEGLPLVDKRIVSILKDLKSSMRKLQMDSIDLFHTADELIAYAKKYIAPSSKVIMVGGPITEIEKNTYHPLPKRVSDKIARIQTALDSSPLTQPLHTIFIDPTVGILPALSKYYTYQLKYELSTDEVDQVITQLEQLVRHVFEPQRASLLSLDTPEVKELLAVMEKIANGALLEGVERAVRRGLSGVVKFEELRKACLKQRSEFYCALTTQIHQFILLVNDSQLSKKQV